MKEMVIINFSRKYKKGNVIIVQCSAVSNIYIDITGY